MNKFILNEIGLAKLASWGIISKPPAQPKPPVAKPIAMARVKPKPVKVVSQPSELKQTTIIQLQELATTVSNCTQCNLCSGRTKTVFGTEAITPGGILFVGEAPGEQEDQQGVPFVGPAGKLLDAMLRSVDYERGNGVYITNVVKCRPPNNRDPEQDEIAACRGFLVKQIELIAPSLIIAVGKVAGNALLDTEKKLPLNQMRGKTHQFSNVPLLVIYHPSYYLHNPNAKPAGWQDMLTLRKEHNRLNAGGF